MKKKILTMVMTLLLTVGIVMAAPVAKISIIGNDPIYTETKFQPLVFLNEDGGRAVIDDPYGFFANGDIAIRRNNYAFTGEQIVWEVLVWDKNGAPDKINDVWAGWVAQTNGPLDPEKQVNCMLTNPSPSGNLASNGYSNVRRPNDQEPQVSFNPDTMALYTCVLTIENGCHGQKWLGVKAEDIDGETGTMQESESWFCNPSLNIAVSGDINFGNLGPGEQGAATFSVQNNGEVGSGIEMVLAISGTDFYDPSSSPAKCPVSNVLALQGDQLGFTEGFWYTATQGANQVGQKRIPYANDITETDPIFSSSNMGNQWRDWSGGLLPMSPGSEASVTLRLGIPQPCNGAFTSGEINLWGLAI